jgi:hypothetical protein
LRKNDYERAISKMKKAFETPLVEWIQISGADILCTSGCIKDPSDEDGTEFIGG